MSFVSKLLKIHAGEGAKVMTFAALGALLQAGLAIGISASDSLFLTRVGADQLPMIYMILPAIMLVYISLFAYLMGRFGIDRLFSITLGILSVGGIAIFALLSTGILGGDPPVWLYYVAKLYSALWYIAQYTLLWNFVDCYFDILDAKRLFSFLSGGMAFGAMLGGAAVTLLVRVVAVEHLFLVWSVLALSAFPVLWRLRRRWRMISEEEATGEATRVSFREQAGRIWQLLRNSRYSNFMILAFLGTLVITTLCEFQYMQVFEAERTDAEVAALFGRLYMIVNAFNVVVNLLLFNRLVSWIGVRNTALVQPVVYAVTFSYLLLDYGFGAAVAGFFAYQGILTSVEYNNQNFLFNALPSRVKAQVRTFIEGLCEPLATAAAGVFLMVYSSKLSAQEISLVGLAGTGVALCAVLGLRAHYLKAMVGNLKDAWLDFSRGRAGRLSALDTGECVVLERLALSADTDRALVAISLYRKNDAAKAASLLLGLIDRSDMEQQAATAGLLDALLEAEDSDILRRVLEWLDRAKARLHPHILEVCGRHNLLSPEIVRSLSETSGLSRQTAAAVARWQSWRPDDGLESMRVTQSFIRGTEAEKVAAIHIVGMSGQTRYAHFLAGYLDDPSSDIRRQALRSVARLVDASSDRLVPEILSAIRSGDQAMRRMGFEALVAIGDPACVQPLSVVSVGFPPCDRREAEAVILSIGLRSVPILTAMLRDSSVPYTRKSMAARALGNLSFPQFEVLAPDLVRSGIRSAYDYMVREWVIMQGAELPASQRFLARLYGDIQRSMLGYVLELLTIAGRLPDYEMVASSLRSKSMKKRGDAIEMIEQGCSHEVFRLLLPLVDSRSLEERVRFYTHAFAVQAPGSHDIVLDSIGSDLCLESAAAIQAAWWMSGMPDSPVTRTELLVRMQQRLVQADERLAEDVIFALLQGASTEGVSQSVLHNPMERAECLSRAELFCESNLMELMAIVTGSTSVEMDGAALYRCGTVCDNIYIVVEGSVECGPRFVECGGLVGGEALVGAEVYTHDALARGATLLAIPVGVVLATAELYPPFAIQLVGYRLGVRQREEEAS